MEATQQSTEPDLELDELLSSLVYWLEHSNSDVTRPFVKGGLNSVLSDLKGMYRVATIDRRLNKTLPRSRNLSSVKMMRIAAHRSFSSLFERLEKSAKPAFVSYYASGLSLPRQHLRRIHSKEISFDRAAGRIRI